MRLLKIAKPADAESVAPSRLLDPNAKDRPLLVPDSLYNAIATSGVLADEITEWAEQLVVNTGIVSTSPTLSVGYDTGAGGAVTQITSASTGVTLSKPCGQITTVALTTAAAAEERFTVTNTLVDANDVICLSTTYNGAGTPGLSVCKVAAGAFDIVITNLHAANAFDAVMVINFVLLKSVAA